jgi:hypothetical protein
MTDKLMFENIITLHDKLIYERGKKRGKELKLDKVNQEIDDLIDHYEPYRPILDSKEAQEVRKVLIKLKETIK